MPRAITLFRTLTPRPSARQPVPRPSSSRARARTTITEVALWGKPAILIPIPESISHDQRTNAYAYAHTGAR